MPGCKEIRLDCHSELVSESRQLIYNPGEPEPNFFWK